MVAEGTVQVNQEVAIAGSEHKAGTELKRIFPEPVLPVSGCLGAASRF